MKKFALLLALIVSVSAFFGCSSVAPVCATSNDLGSKVGTNTAAYIFGIIPIGGTDFGIAGAAKNGGITKISTVDLKTFSYLFGFYRGNTTIVTGE
ncbi:MAG: TRL domain-containing protein [Spirochaetia bacterium]|nr:TRL domain-containing protein [Spirochaetia bacterium]